MDTPQQVPDDTADTSEVPKITTSNEHLEDVNAESTRRAEEDLRRRQEKAKEEVERAIARIADYREETFNERAGHVRPFAKKTERVFAGKAGASNLDASVQLPKKKRTFKQELEIAKSVAAESERKEKQSSMQRAAQRRELKTQIEDARLFLAGQKNLDVRTKEDRRAEFEKQVEHSFQYLQSQEGFEDVKHKERHLHSPGAARRRGRKNAHKERPSVYPGDTATQALINEKRFENYEGPTVDENLRDTFLNRAARGAGKRHQRRGSADSSDLHSLAGGTRTAGSPHHASSTTVAQQQQARSLDLLLQDSWSKIQNSPKANRRFFPTPVLDSSAHQEEDASVSSSRAGSLGLSPISKSSVSFITTSDGRRVRYVPDVTRTTASMRQKKTYYCQTFFDEYGSINGEKERLDALPPLRPGHGYISEDRQIEATRKAKEEQMNLLHQRQRAKAAAEERKKDSEHGRSQSVPLSRQNSMSGTFNEATFGSSTTPKHGKHTAQRRLSAGSTFLTAGGGTSLNLPAYQGPKHELSTKTVPVPDERRVQELIAGVFVKGGDVSSYLRKMEREAKQGLLRSDNRKSVRDRLGGTSKGRL